MNTILAALLALGLSALLAACGSSPSTRAPVEDRGASSTTTAPVAVAQPVPVTGAIPAPATADKLPPGAENAGKPGYYTVKPGDTMIRIGMDTGQNWRDIVRWNLLANPNQIEVGQVLRVIPPVAGAAPTAGTGAVVASPVPARNAQASTVPPAGAASVPGVAAPAPVVASVPAAPAPATAPAAADDELAWMWPAEGQVIAAFDEVKNKGLGIAGVAGTAVVAAADGRVVYVGSGLRGYGNLVILKHNNTYLTAYAHNRALLVKEDQNVRKGQKIAEMGNSDADRVKLHFELRRQGKPVDPVKYLPPR
ncbi:MAG: hypothetical protein RLZZ126_1812 [Pseudomonadota bacterium]|jgi:lipoprotein NlpD